MVTAAQRTDKLLVYSPSAGSVTPEVQQRLHAEFDDFTFVEFPPALDWLELLTKPATGPSPRWPRCWPAPTTCTASWPRAPSTTSPAASACRPTSRRRSGSSR